MSKTEDEPRLQSVWLGDLEVSAERYEVRARGIDPKLLLPGRKLRQALLETPLLRGVEAHFRAFAGGCVGSVVSKEGHLLLEADPRGELRVAVRSMRSPTRVVRMLEALFLRLQPREVALAGEGGSSSFWPYMSEGALFVRMIHSEKSAFQQIEVGEHPVFGRMLFLNGETQIASSDEALYTASLVQPALRKATQSVLILGGGDCGVLREVCAHPGLLRALMIEIDPQVVEVARRFFPETVGSTAQDARAEIRTQDALSALTELAAAGERFDLVVYDLSDEPLALEDQDQLCERVRAVLAPKGRVAVQCGSALPRSKAQLSAHLAGLRKFFRKVETRQCVIPSFLDQPWVFARARPKRD